ncbi:MAG: family 78 glycoside hydrolase catalytic domain, partial [Sphingobacteriaceae bacterium]
MKRLITLLLFIFSISQLSAQVTVSNLRCEMLQNPQGIDVKQPRLSWQLQSNLRNVQQSAYQILMASSAEQLNANKGDVWDSGKINSGQSVLINYAGKALAAKSPYFWKVKVYTNQGEVWSQPAQFSTGIFYKVDWKGRWIGMDKAFAWESVSQWSKLSARYLRKDFKSEKTVKRAMVYLMGMGLYELYLNGNKVGDAVLAPVPTDYFQQVNYNTYDVTAQIQSGKNTIGTILGNGRYFTMRQDYKPYKIKNFGFPKLLLNLEIEYTDGSRESISTDETWKLTADGPIRSNNEYDGEEYDARKEFLNWSKPGFDDSKWMNAEFVQEPGGKYAAQMTPNMKVMETIKPLSVKLLKPGVYILDMGQNMAGWLKMQMKGSAGTQVNLKFAETLKEDGSLFTRNLRDAQSTDTYILKGGETETWEPRFVYHGFRYVEISGFPGTPTIHNFEGRVVYDDLSTSGSFSSSNPVLNQVYQNAYWGIRANYKGMPVDCPQRNERQPWLGDRTVGAYGESFLFNNATLYAKWLDDI